MPERYRRSEDALADLIRENRRGTRDAQRATGTEKAQTAVLAQAAWDQSEFAKQLAEQLETDLGPLPGQVQDALDDASAALAEAGLARSDAAAAVSDAQAAVAEAQAAAGAAGDAFAAAVEAQGVADQVAAGQVVIGRTVDGLNRTFTSVESPGRGYIGHENLAPSIVGDGTYAEVRRNLCPNPFSAPGGADIGYANLPNPSLTHSASLPISTPDGRTTGLMGAVPGGSTPTNDIFSVYSLDSLYNTSGVERSVGAWFMVDAPGYAAYFYGDTPVALEPNEWKWVTTNTPVAGNTFTTAFISKTVGSAGASDSGYVTGVTSVAGAIPPDAPFDGSSPQGSVDPDMRQRWLGTPNASESVMEIERVAGLYASNCVAGVSTKAGKPAMRLIPTASNADSFAQLIIPSGAARLGGTALGTSSSDAPLTSPVNPNGYALGIRTVTPNGYTGRPNDAVSRQIRHTYTALTADYGLRWYHGGAQGSGDVWWTDIGLFAGDLPEDAEKLHQEDVWYRLETRAGKLVMAQVLIWNGDDWAPYEMWVDSLAAADSVTARTIAANAITSVKILAEAITTEKIAALAVTAAQVAANAITAVKLAANAVTAEKINAGAVTTDKLDALAVTAEKIAAGAIVANKIAANAITTAKLAADAIDGMTITGALIRTAASGQRMHLDINGLRAFDSGNVQRALLAASSGGLLLSGTLTSYTGGNTQRAVLSNGDLTFDYVGSPGAGTMTLGPGGITSTDADSRFKILKTSSAAGVGIDIIAGSGSYETGINIHPALKKISLFAESVEFKGGELSTDVSVDLASILSLASGTSIDGSSWLRKRSDGIVFGTLAFYRAAGYTSGATIATLAAGYQPIGGDQLPAVMWGAAAPSRCHFRIDPTGAIVAWSPGVNRQYISAKVMYRTS